MKRQKFENIVDATPENLAALGVLRQMLLLLDEPYMPFNIRAIKETAELETDVCAYRLGLLPLRLKNQTLVPEITELRVKLENNTDICRPVLSKEFADEFFESIVEDQVLFYLAPGSTLELILQLEKNNYTKSYKFSLTENISITQEPENKIKITFFYYADEQKPTLEKLFSIVSEEGKKLLENILTAFEDNL